MPAKPKTLQRKTPDDSTILGWCEFTLADWKALRVKLINPAAAKGDWLKAFSVLENRWKSRYLEPIDLLEKHGRYEGEGFSIMTIACCLLESVASAYYGKVYHHNDEVRTALVESYNAPDENYLNILQEHPSFKFSKGLAERFYRGVRCGLVHEARTKSEFQIKANSTKPEIALVTESAIVINRCAFVQAVKKVISSISSRVAADTDKARNKLARHLDATFGRFDGDDAIANIHLAQKSNTWWPTPK